MLVLSRHVNGVIRISHDIQVIVVDIRDDKVRLGVRAPEEIAVHREEIYQAIRERAVASLLASGIGQACEEQIRDRMKTMIGFLKGQQ